MWSADPSRRLALKALAVTAGAGLLGGCFTPLYGDPAVVAGGRNAQVHLQALDIPEIPGRTGVVLRNELIYLTQGGGGRAAAPTHQLAIDLRTDTVPLFLDTTAGRPASQSVSLTGHFTVLPIGGDNVPVYRGTAHATASFDRTAQRFASDRAIIEAQERAAKVLAEQIVTQLAAWYASRGA